MAEPLPLKLSAAAARDLAEIDRHGIAQFGEAVAADYLRGFVASFDLLCASPRAGAARPDIGPDIRLLVHRRHRIFYRLSDQAIVVVRILHHARMVPPL